MIILFLEKSSLMKKLFMTLMMILLQNFDLK